MLSAGLGLSPGPGRNAIEAKPGLAGTERTGYFTNTNPPLAFIPIVTFEIRQAQKLGIAADGHMLDADLEQCTGMLKASGVYVLKRRDY